MAASMRRPVVVVLGATGTGKSKLAIELGRAFKGEIISADSMQVYKGLDIITNKVTQEEQSQCPHHLLDYLSPLCSNNNVWGFRNAALPIIDGLLTKSKIPIIVGGTNYYIESLLWKFLVSDEDVQKASDTCEKLGSNVAHHDVSGREESSDTASPETDVPEIAADTTKTADDTGNVGSRAPQWPETGGAAAHGGDGCELVGGGVCERTQDSQNLLLPSDVRQDKCRDSDLPATDDSESGSAGSSDDDALRRSMEREETAVLYRKLMEVDPVSGRRIHPNNRRKIIRTIEIYERHGVPASEVYRAQHEGVSGEAVSGGLRYPHTCVFWLQCNQAVLDKRLDGRVDAMLDQGLVKEMTDFHTHYNQHRLQDNQPPDYTHGIFQSIGFKEFHQYLLLSEEERESVKGRKLLQQGITDLKTVTRRYARKQIQWIKSRFLKRPGANVPPVYGLDGSDVSQWNTLVNGPATQILTAVLKGETPDIEPIPHLGDRETKYIHNVCDICDGRVFVVEKHWQDHIKSQGHRKRLGSQKRARQRELKKLSDTLSAIAGGNQNRSGEGDGSVGGTQLEEDS